MVGAAISAGDLVHLFPQYHRDGGGIYAVYPSHRHPTAALRAFVDFLLEVAAG
jgi:DNA-binding transcriptional LysR family regulator